MQEAYVTNMYCEHLNYLLLPSQERTNLEILLIKELLTFLGPYRHVLVPDRLLPTDHSTHSTS
jgi:hypothetical protein